jgi:hypothetical protein
MKKKYLLWAITILLLMLMPVLPRLGRYNAYRRYVNHPDIANNLRTTVNELELDGSPTTPNIDLGYAQLHLPEDFVRDETPNQFGVRNAKGEVVFWSSVRVPSKPSHSFDQQSESFIKRITGQSPPRDESPDAPQVPQLSIDPDTIDFNLGDNYYLAFLEAQPMSPWQASGMDAQAYTQHLNNLVHKTLYYDLDWVGFEHFETEHIHGYIRWMEGHPYRQTLARVFDKKSGVTQHLQIKTNDPKLIRDVLGSLRFTLDTLPGKDEMKRLHLEADLKRIDAAAQE